MSSTPPSWLDQQASPDQPEGPQWHACVGLTLRQAEELLDWLDACGYEHSEVAIDPKQGVSLRWRSHPG
jgi:hypothetical protein